MAYISSNANRWYSALESAYGQIAAITAANRIPAVTMTANQQREKSQRKDKTGSRTFAGLPAGMRLQTTFDVTSYMRDWPDTTVHPSHGPMVQAAMGAPGALWGGNTAGAGSTASNIRFATPHGLSSGQAITSGGEIRFVANVVDPTTVELNAPLSLAPASGAAIGQTATYCLSTQLPSVSLYDYWDPSSAVQRVFSGAAVDKMSIQLNGDFHQFQFSGIAQDLIDSASFTAGQGEAAAFPAEPSQNGFSYSLIPGNLGQVWLGAVPTQFLTVANASVQLQNDLDLRAKEFGTVLPLAIVPGMRFVAVTLELLSQDDAASTALYQAARTETPISVMFQIGQVPGQLVGVYLKSLVPGVPLFDDADKRRQWKFSDTRAHGSAEDEIVVAFG
jgi:hypothetical protein